MRLIWLKNGEKMRQQIHVFNEKINSLTSKKLSVILSNFSCCFYYLKIYKFNKIEIDYINLKSDDFRPLEMKENPYYLLVKMSKEKLVSYLDLLNFEYLEIYDDFISFSKFNFDDFDGDLDVKNYDPNLFIFIDRKIGEFGGIYRYCNAGEWK